MEAAPTPRGPMRLRVELTEAEHDECVALAAARTDGGNARGQGEGTQTSESHSGSEVDLAGVEGEWAFSKGALPEFQRPRGAGVDTGWDFWLPGFEIDVKTALGPNRNFLVAEGRELTAQAGVHVERLSCRSEGADGCVFLIVGWVLSWEWRQFHVDAGAVFDGLSGSLYWRHYLRTIDTFLPWLESKGVLAETLTVEGTESMPEGGLIEVDDEMPVARAKAIRAAEIGVVW